jgi:hypothetical protein
MVVKWHLLVWKRCQNGLTFLVRLGYDQIRFGIWIVRLVR